jgi:hypothetical protein
MDEGIHFLKQQGVSEIFYNLHAMQTSGYSIELKGAISDGEVRHLNKIYGEEEIQVYRLEVKSASTDPLHHALEIVFHDFNVLVFARDFFLTELVKRLSKTILPYLTLSIQYFKKKSKKVHKISIVIIVHCKGNPVKLHLEFNPEVEQEFLKAIEQFLDQVIPQDFCDSKDVFILFKSGQFTVTTF